MNEIARLDYRLFEIINGDFSNEFFDHVMPVFTDLHRSPAFVTIAILALGAWIWKKRKNAAIVILGLVLSVALSETISYRLIKNYVSRPRPEFTPAVTVQLKTHSHSGKSFPSLHASNNFAAATYLTLAFGWIGSLFFIPAALVAFSRVYVGVHFPADVIVGAIVGIICGLSIRLLMKRLKMT